MTIFMLERQSVVRVTPDNAIMSAFGEMPLPPLQPNRTSDRVKDLVLDNMEVLQLPSMGPIEEEESSNSCSENDEGNLSQLRLQPLGFHGKLANEVLEKMRTSQPRFLLPTPAVGPQCPASTTNKSPTPSSKPGLSHTVRSPARRMKMMASNSFNVPNKGARIPMTPVRQPPPRANSGLARCA